ncbi:L-2-amino-thiazoline-4-carboxylic acid hydrolase [Chloroflexota bacterium]
MVLLWGAFIGLIAWAVIRFSRQSGSSSKVNHIEIAKKLYAKGLIPIIDPLRKKLSKLTTKDPVAYLEKRLKDMIKYPYSKPGYKIEFYKDKNVYCMDIYSCPVFDFYKQFGEEELALFRKTWCTFDYTAAEHVVEGGKHEREHTLSDGDAVCDMRWFINKR